MHNSFGMETAPRSLRWNDLVKGPSVADVRAHTLKIGRYRQVALPAPTR